jgi:hypothetical protein
MGVLEGLADIRLGSLVDILAVNCDVRFTPEADIRRCKTNVR